MAVITKRCPKCGGILFTEQDASDIDYICLCGYRRFVYRDYRRALPVNGNTGKMIGRFRGYTHPAQSGRWDGATDNVMRMIEA